MLCYIYPTSLVDLFDYTNYVPNKHAALEKIVDME